MNEIITIISVINIVFQHDKPLISTNILTSIHRSRTFIMVNNKLLTNYPQRRSKQRKPISVSRCCLLTKIKKPECNLFGCFKNKFIVMNNFIIMDYGVNIEKSLKYSKDVNFHLAFSFKDSIHDIYITIYDLISTKTLKELTFKHINSYCYSK